MKTPVQPPLPDLQLDTIDSQRLQLHHLHAEFARVDVLIRREVRRWVVAGQDPNDDYRGMYIAQVEAEALLERPFGTSWGQWITLPTEEEAAFESAHQAAMTRVAALEVALQERGHTPRLQSLTENFALDQTELDILLLCIAPAFDTSYERLYGYLQDNVTKRRPSVRLVLDILGRPGVDQFEIANHLTNSSPLFTHGLLEYVIEPPPANGHWLNQTLHADETVIAWLRGHHEHHGALAEQLCLEKVTATETDRILVAPYIEQLSTALQTGESSGTAPIIALYGADQGCQDAAARLLAVQSGQLLLRMNLEVSVTGSGGTGPGDKESRAANAEAVAQAVRLTLRYARLTRATAYIRGWDTCLDIDKYAATAPLAQICEHPGLIILSSRSEWRPKNIQRTRTIAWQGFGIPTYSQRQTLWQQYLYELTDGKITLPQGELDSLAGQFELTSGTIHDAVAAAHDARFQIWDSELWTQDLFAAARRYSNPRLSSLARKIDPRYAWNDMVLPQEQREILQELIATIRQRPKVLEEWGVGKKLAASAGVTVLFAGPPGTGKTMAAEVIAGELRLDLYKIDLRRW